MSNIFILPGYSQPDSPCNCNSATQQVVGTTGEETFYDIENPFSPNRCYFIKGILVIHDEGNVIWDGLKIEMEEGAEIRVESHLSINNCYISACEVMWKGIQLTPESDFFIYYSFIRSAEIGIHMPGNIPGFICRYTKFINNYIGIGAGSPFDEESMPKTIQRGEIYGCEFYTDTYLPDPYPGQYYDPTWPSEPNQIYFDQGYAGIFFSHAVAINIGLPSAGEEERNIIHNMRNGIIILNSSTNILGTDIYNLSGTKPIEPFDAVLDLNQYAIYVQQSVLTIRDNDIDNVLTGIYANESLTEINNNEISLSTSAHSLRLTRGIHIEKPSGLSIKNNQIHDGWRSVVIEDVNSPISVINNDINRDIPVRPGNVGIQVRNLEYLNGEEGFIKGNSIDVIDGNGTIGIHLVNVNHLTAIDNDIYYGIDDGMDVQNRGIIIVGGGGNNIIRNSITAHEDYLQDGNHAIHLVGSSDNLIECNILDNFWANILVLGANTQTQFVGNSINDAFYGLELEGPTMIGSQIISVEIGEQEHNNNQWLGVYGGIGAFGAHITEMNPLISAQQSLFFIDSEADSDYLPDPIGPPEVDDGNWFKDFPSILPVSLSCISNIIYPVTEPDTLAALILKPLAFDEYNDQMTWFKKADVFEMMMHNENLFEHSVLDSFFEAEETNALGKLVILQIALASRYGVVQPEKSLTQDTINYLLLDLRKIDSILFLRPNDSMSWIALRALKSDTLSLVFAHWDALVTEEIESSLTAFADMEDDLDEITPTNDLEEYLKDALYKKLQYVQGESFSSGDSTELVEFVELCPWLGGRSISLGQELFASLYDTLLLTQGSCPEPSPFISFPGKYNNNIHSKFTMYPNPAFNETNFKSESTISELKLKNTSNQVLWSYNPNSSSFSVQLNNIPPGFYIVSATIDNEVILSSLIRI